MRLATISFDLFGQCFLDILFIILLFVRMSPERNVKIRFKIIGVLSLLSLSVLYFFVLVPGESRAILLIDSFTRNVIRILLVSVYLWTSGKSSVKKSLYLGIYSLILRNSYALVYILIIDYFIKKEYTPYFFIFRIICMTSVFLLSYFLVDMNKIKSIGIQRTGTILLNASCLVYISGSFRFVSRIMQHSATFQYFLLMLIIFLLACTLMTERNLAVQEELTNAKVQGITDSYKIRHYREIQKNNENVRTLAHDMKNHLLAIRQMSESGENEKIISYIDQMTDNFSLNIIKIHTGNDLIDSIISDKINESSEYKIQYSVLMGASLLERISDMDLCTIFGNALDNAVEACKKIDNAEKRFITIKSGVAANQVIIEFVNSSCEMPLIENSLPVSTKADRLNHGIGLKSIKKAVEKYGGIMSIESNEKIFRLILMLPK